MGTLQNKEFQNEASSILYLLNLLCQSKYFQVLKHKMLQSEQNISKSQQKSVSVFSETKLSNIETFAMFYQQVLIYFYSHLEIGSF